jgi:hypothetical protein
MKEHGTKWDQWMESFSVSTRIFVHLFASDDALQSLCPCGMFQRAYGEPRIQMAEVNDEDP